MAERAVHQSPAHLCPWWVGYLLASPVRRLFYDPRAVVGGHVRPGMTVIDLGCGLGYFSIPMARMVGVKGHVVCVDVQERMLRGLRKRALKAGVLAQLELRLAGRAGLNLEDLAASVDFVLALAVMHEIADPALALSEIVQVLCPAGELLLCEPKGHVSAEAFAATVKRAEEAGLILADRPQHARTRSALLTKGLRR